MDEADLDKLKDSKQDKKAAHLEKKAVDLDDEIKKEQDKQKELKRQSDEHERMMDLAAPGIAECKETEIVDSSTEAISKYQVIISDLENEDFEKFLEYKESQGKAPLAKRIRKKNDREIIMYKDAENAKRKTLAKRNREAQVKKIYQLKQSAEQYIHSLLGSSQELEQTTSHGKDSYGKFERTVS